MTTIRPLAAFDTPALDAIITALANDPTSLWPRARWYASTGTPAQWLAAQPSTTRLVATRDAVVVGHVGLGPVTDPQLASHLPQVTDPATAYELVRLFVAPSTRRQGVATALLTAATELILALGLTPVLSCFDEPPPHPPAALYLRHGWQPFAADIGTDSGLPFTCYWLPPPK